MKWAILFVSSSFHISFSPLPTSQILPLFHLHRFLPSAFILFVYQRLTMSPPSFCLQSAFSLPSAVLPHLISLFENFSFGHTINHKMLENHRVYTFGKSSANAKCITLVIRLYHSSHTIVSL